MHRVAAWAGYKETTGQGRARLSRGSRGGGVVVGAGLVVEAAGEAALALVSTTSLHPCPV